MDNPQVSPGSSLSSDFPYTHGFLEVWCKSQRAWGGLVCTEVTDEETAAQRDNDLPTVVQLTDRRTGTDTRVS